MSHPDEENTNATGGGSGADPIPADRMTFAHNLRRARKEAGITQDEMARRSGLAQPFLSEVENGKTTINLDNASKLAAAVGQPLHKLLTPE